MYQPIRTALEGRFRSVDALAKALVQDHPALDWPGYRSLSAKIGQLDQGKTVWWQHRPEQLQALVDHLGLSSADVGIHASPADGLFHFTHFPELPPLDVRREHFCDIAGPAPDSDHRTDSDLDLWFDRGPRGIRRMPTSTIWLHVPPGTGRSVLLAGLAGAGRYDVLVSTTLASSPARITDPEPVVIAISEDGGVAVLAALARRPEDAGTLVVAPFPAPSRSEADPLEDYSWEWMSAEGLDRQLLSMTNPQGLRRAIHPGQWRLGKDWREKLLDWVDARLARYGCDTLFSSRGLSRWLADFDPLQEWIRTPADLMTLCRVSHRTPDTRLPGRGAPAAGQQLLTAILSARPDQEAVFTGLACARWASLGDPWRESLPYAVWQGWHVAPGAVGHADLLAIADAPDPQARRRQAALVAGQLGAADLRPLVTAGLLVRDAKGHFDLEPRVLADLVVRDHVLATMRNDGAGSWAMACFDTARRATIDAALDALDGSDLQAVVEGVLQLPDRTPAGLAASEALFCAVGRRLLHGRQVPDGVLVLSSVVVPRLPLADDPWSVPAPWTRTLATDAERYEWLAVCWAWSLTPIPSIPALGNYSGWLFAGWCAVLPDVPYWLQGLPAAIKEGTGPHAWKNLLKAGYAVVRQRSTPVPAAPALLHGALLAASIYGAWPAEAGWWEALFDDDCAAEMLFTQLKHHGHAGALRLWPSLITHEAAAGSLSNISVRFSRIRMWMLDQLDASEVLTALRPEQRSYVTANVFSLPPAVRQALLDSVPAEELERDIGSAYRMLRLCGPAAVGSLVRWLDTGIRHMAAERMWELDQRFTVQWAETNAAEQPELAGLVLEACPGSASLMGAELLLRDRSLLAQDARRAWVRARLPGSGTAAATLIAILDTAGGPA